MGWILRLLLVLGSTIGSVQALALSEIVAPAVTASSRTQTTPTLILKQSHFINNSATYYSPEEKSDSLTAVGLGLSIDSPGEQWAPVAHMSAFYSTTEGLPYIDLEEAYLKKNLFGQRLRIGRKKIEWSRFDSHWGMGLWQPRFRWDKSDPNEQGLIGIFGQRQLDSKWSVTWAALPVTMPDIAASAQIRKRKIYSSNPWFRPPPPSVQINGKERELVSSVNSPSAAEILMRPGLAAKIERKNTKSLYRLSYAFKPSNFVYLSFPYVFKLYEDKSEAEIELNASFINHSIVALESFESTDIGEFGYGATVNWPHQNNLKKDWISQGAYRGVLGYLSYSPEFIIPISLNYLWSEGGNGSDIGSITNSGHSLFEQRYMWQNAFSVKLEKLNLAYIKAWNLSANSNVLYDFDQKAGTVKTQFSLEKGGWDFRLSGLLIGIIDTSEPKNEDGFARNYRANDFMEASVSYVY